LKQFIKTHANEKTTGNKNHSPHEEKQHYGDHTFSFPF